MKWDDFFTRNYNIWRTSLHPVNNVASTKAGFRYEDTLIRCVVCSWAGLRDFQYRRSQKLNTMLNLISALTGTMLERCEQARSVQLLRLLLWYGNSPWSRDKTTIFHKIVLCDKSTRPKVTWILCTQPTKRLWFYFTAMGSCFHSTIWFLDAYPLSEHHSCLYSTKMTLLWYNSC